MNDLVNAAPPVGGGAAKAAEIESATNVPNVRDTILREAAVLFSTKGFAESGLRELAEMAGIRSSTVYYYFGSKERIYEEIIRVAIDAIFASVSAELAALPADATPRMRVEAAMRGHVRALHANKPFTSTNAQSRIKLPDEVNAVIRPLRHRYSEFWRELLEQAAVSGWIRPGLDPRMLRPLIIGTLNRTVAWFDESQGPLQALIDTIVVTFSGIWSDPPSRARAKAPGASAAKPKRKPAVPAAPRHARKTGSR